MSDETKDKGSKTPVSDWHAVDKLPLSVIPLSSASLNDLSDSYGSPTCSWPVFTTTEIRRLRGSLRSAPLSGI